MWNKNHHYSDLILKLFFSVWGFLLPPEGHTRLSLSCKLLMRFTFHFQKVAVYFHIENQREWVFPFCNFSTTLKVTVTVFQVISWRHLTITLIKTQAKGWAMAQSVMHLFYKFRDPSWSSEPTIKKSSITRHVYNPVLGSRDRFPGIHWLTPPKVLGEFRSQWETLLQTKKEKEEKRDGDIWERIPRDVLHTHLPLQEQMWTCEHTHTHTK